jgi:two-component system, OmpR family, response regulator
VARGRVLVIEHEEWEAALLTRFLSEAGFDVHVATEARAGFDKVRELQPDCILCSVTLPDIDGFWVARRVRTEPTRVASTPFMFLTDEADRESRLQGLNVGADLNLTKPFRSDEVVAQVAATIEMANRLRSRRELHSPEGSQSGPPAAIEGDLAQMSVATVLTLLELERRSARLEVRGERERVALLELVEGMFDGGTLDGKPWGTMELVREVLRWKRGRFSLHGTGRVSTPGAGEQQKIGGLLLEAMRLEDESRR